MITTVSDLRDELVFFNENSDIEFRCILDTEELSLRKPEFDEILKLKDIEETPDGKKTRIVLGL